MGHNFLHARAHQHTIVSNIESLVPITHLPSELDQVTFILVYIPGPDYTGVAERVAECYKRTVNRLIDQAVFVLGDFNRCGITSVLPYLHQKVTCLTRLNKTIDLCYSKIPDAFGALRRPALRRSDHNLIQQVPKYRQRVKREKPKTHSVRIWDHDNSETLRGAFYADWQVFYDGCSDNVDEIADTVTSYIQFCEQI